MEPTWIALCFIGLIAAGAVIALIFVKWVLGDFLP